MTMRKAEARATPGRPPDVRKDELILEAGRTLLLAGGPAALTMDAVARASGVSKATLYRRWPHREALLEALVLREAQPLLGMLETVPADAAGLAAVLERFLEQLLAFVGRPPYRAYLQAIAALPQSQADLQRIWRLGPQQAIDAVASLLRRHAAAQGRRWPGAARDAETLIGMVMGMELARILYRQPPRRADARLRRRLVRAVARDFLDTWESGREPVTKR
ncbi:Nucleoid occlusion factor SlmA [Tepidimonas sediminis]|uniref:Nucleoid occlusion factor SlmA n=1 Tax=Tepidimonas sediminis TaxID=2588941 RepID=A0A554WSH1_9BURK|nr:TetR/AcrR family transcriptional regulator [Tepidimonas sediminis]TSE26515.1 Nucleoid occlusion factor SlmA [Tepidimonas sediminis]